MSASGISGKATGESKSSGTKKFNTVNINSVYSGKSAAGQKPSASKHGLQSLGKSQVVARRMPPPADLPSLRAESSGQDININLVPTGGSGWGSQQGPNQPSSDTNTGQKNVQPLSQTQNTAQKESNSAAARSSGVVGGSSIPNPPSTTSISMYAAAMGTIAESNRGSGIWGHTSAHATGTASTMPSAAASFFGAHSRDFPQLAGGGKGGSANVGVGSGGLSLRPQKETNWKSGSLGSKAAQAAESDDDDETQRSQAIVLSGQPNGRAPSPGRGGSGSADGSVGQQSARHAYSGSGSAYPMTSTFPYGGKQLSSAGMMPAAGMPNCVPSARQASYPPYLPYPLPPHQYPYPYPPMHGGMPPRMMFPHPRGQYEGDMARYYPPVARSGGHFNDNKNVSLEDSKDERRPPHLYDGPDDYDAPDHITKEASNVGFNVERGGDRGVIWSDDESATAEKSREVTRSKGASNARRNVRASYSDVEDDQRGPAYGDFQRKGMHHPHRPTVPPQYPHAYAQHGAAEGRWYPGNAQAPHSEHHYNQKFQPAMMYGQQGMYPAHVQSGDARVSGSCREAYHHPASEQRDFDVDDEDESSKQREAKSEKQAIIELARRRRAPAQLSGDSESAPSEAFRHEDEEYDDLEYARANSRQSHAKNRLSGPATGHSSEMHSGGAGRNAKAPYFANAEPRERQWQSAAPEKSSLESMNRGYNRHSQNDFRNVEGRETGGTYEGTRSFHGRDELQYGGAAEERGYVTTDGKKRSSGRHSNWEGNDDYARSRINGDHRKNTATEYIQRAGDEVQKSFNDSDRINRRSNGAVKSSPQQDRQLSSSFDSSPQKDDLAVSQDDVLPQTQLLAKGVVFTSKSDASELDTSSFDDEVPQMQSLGKSAARIVKRSLTSSSDQSVETQIVGVDSKAATSKIDGSQTSESAPYIDNNTFNKAKRSVEEPQPKVADAKSTVANMATNQRPQQQQSGRNVWEERKEKNKVAVKNAINENDFNAKNNKQSGARADFDTAADKGGRENVRSIAAGDNFDTFDRPKNTERGRGPLRARGHREFYPSRMMRGASASRGRGGSRSSGYGSASHRSASAWATNSDLKADWTALEGSHKNNRTEALSDGAALLPSGDIKQPDGPVTTNVANPGSFDEAAAADTIRQTNAQVESGSSTSQTTGARDNEEAVVNVETTVKEKPKPLFEPRGNYQGSQRQKSEAGPRRGSSRGGSNNNRSYANNYYDNGYNYDQRASQQRSSGRFGIGQAFGGGNSSRGRAVTYNRSGRGGVNANRSRGRAAQHRERYDNQRAENSREDNVDEFGRNKDDRPRGNRDNKDRKPASENLNVGKPETIGSGEAAGNDDRSQSAGGANDERKDKSSQGSKARSAGEAAVPPRFQQQPAPARRSGNRYHNSGAARDDYYYHGGRRGYARHDYPSHHHTESSGASSRKNEFVKSEQSDSNAPVEDQWETASESSDIGERQRKWNSSTGPVASIKDKKAGPKSFSSQRQRRLKPSGIAANAATQWGPGSGPNRRGQISRQHQHQDDSARPDSESYEVADKPVQSKNAQRASAQLNLRTNPPPSVKHVSNANKALSCDNARVKGSQDGGKCALALVDINNIAGVVVIDDQPDSNVHDDHEGFQLVRKKRAKKDQGLETEKKCLSRRSVAEKRYVISRSTKEKDSAATRVRSVETERGKRMPLHSSNMANSAASKRLVDETQSTAAVNQSQPLSEHFDIGYFSSKQPDSTATSIWDSASLATVVSDLSLSTFGGEVAAKPVNRIVPLSKTGVEIWGTPQLSDSILISTSSGCGSTSEPVKSTREIGRVMKPVEFASGYGGFKNSDKMESLVKLDFTFDADLGNSRSIETTHVDSIAKSSLDVPASSAVEQMPVLSSPATDDLNLKIASVKRVWELTTDGRTVESSPEADASSFVCSAASLMSAAVYQQNQQTCVSPSVLQQLPSLDASVDESGLTPKSFSAHSHHNITVPKPNPSSGPAVAKVKPQQHRVLQPSDSSQSSGTGLASPDASSNFSACAPNATVGVGIAVSGGPGNATEYVCLQSTADLFGAQSIASANQQMQNFYLNSSPFFGGAALNAQAYSSFEYLPSGTNHQNLAVNSSGQFTNFAPGSYTGIHQTAALLQIPTGVSSFTQPPPSMITDAGLLGQYSHNVSSAPAAFSTFSQPAVGQNQQDMAFGQPTAYFPTVSVGAGNFGAVGSHYTQKPGPGKFSHAVPGSFVYVQEPSATISINLNQPPPTRNLGSRPPPSPTVMQTPNIFSAVTPSGNAVAASSGLSAANSAFMSQQQLANASGEKLPIGLVRQSSIPPSFLGAPPSAFLSAHGGSATAPFPVFNPTVAPPPAPTKFPIPPPSAFVGLPPPSLVGTFPPPPVFTPTFPAKPKDRIEREKDSQKEKELLLDIDRFIHTGQRETHFNN